MNRLQSLGATALVVAVAACSAGSDRTTGLSANFNLTADDTAQAAVLSSADATSEDANVMLTSEASLDAGSYSADATTGTLTWTRTVTFYDANGAVMPKYNDTTTASINYQLTESGVRVVDNGADTLSRNRNMTVSGLLGHETSRTWNGTSARTDGGYRTDTTKTRTYHVSDNATFANIVVDLPRVDHPFPMSGTVTRNVSGTGAVTKDGVTKTFTLNKTVTITFNGTRYVPMMVGTTAYTLDLVTGKATKN